MNKYTKHILYAELVSYMKFDPASAPALIRGIQLIRLLGDGDTRTLEEIASCTGIPKASALRLLRALAACGIVGRDEISKKYTATEVLTPVTGSAPEFLVSVDAALKKLARASSCTAEWYERGKRGMVLTQRHEPPKAHVWVAARIGFIRRWAQELEAVAIAAYAFGFEPLTNDLYFWTYDHCGKRVSLDSKRARKIIKDACERGYAKDCNFNPQGIRRIACPVIRGDHPEGILALATSFAPEGDRMDAQSSLLIQETRNLSQLS